MVKKPWFKVHSLANLETASTKIKGRFTAVSRPKNNNFGGDVKG
jgi:hypothetical protein